MLLRVGTDSNDSCVVSAAGSGSNVELSRCLEVSSLLASVDEVRHSLESLEHVSWVVSVVDQELNNELVKTNGQIRCEEAVDRGNDSSLGIL